MATLNLTYNTGSVTLADLNNSLAVDWGYPETVIVDGESVPNPQTKAEFNREVLGRFLRQAYRSGKRKLLQADMEANLPDITLD